MPIKMHDDTDKNQAAPRRCKLVGELSLDICNSDALLILCLLCAFTCFSSCYNFAPVQQIALVPLRPGLLSLGKGESEDRQKENRKCAPQSSTHSAGKGSKQSRAESQ